MLNLSFSSFSPIGNTGTPPLPILARLSPGSAFGPEPVIRRPEVKIPNQSSSITSASVAGNGVTAPPAPSNSAATPKSVSASSGRVGGSSASAASTASLAGLVSGYSTTVGGQSYAASLSDTGGEYTASVASLSGASATGTTEEAAENSLEVRIDELA